MTGNERLLVLAKALRANAANPQGARFDLGSWMKFPKDSLGELPSIACGTVVCAVGLATLLPELRAEGLAWEISQWNPRNGTPSFRGRTSFNAVTEFFEVSICEADVLFQENHYTPGPTKGAEAELFVAERIEKFVEDRS